MQNKLKYLLQAKRNNSLSIKLNNKFKTNNYKLLLIKVVIHNQERIKKGLLPHFLEFLKEKMKKIQKKFKVNKVIKIKMLKIKIIILFQIKKLENNNNKMNKLLLLHLFHKMKIKVFQILNLIIKMMIQ